MSSSELSNALNPLIIAQRSRRRHAPAATQVATPAISPAQVPQPHASHRSELELAIAPPLAPPPPPAQVISAPQPLQQPSRNAPPVVRELYRVMATAREATAAERQRRLAWEREQEAKNMQAQAEMERQILDMRQELSMLKAYISMHSNMAPPNEVQDQAYVETIPTTARIEPASPIAEASPRPLMSPVSPVPFHSSLQQTMFVQGSSSRPLTAHALQPQCFLQGMSSPVPSALSSPAQVTPSGSIDTIQTQTASPAFLDLPTPQSTDLSPTSSRPLTPTELNPRKRPRHVVEDESDYETDSEMSDDLATDHPPRRKNGHDRRCITIHHAMRIHIRKMMMLKHGQDLPDSPFEGAPIAPTDPVRFIWTRTTKQSTTNAAMKKRIVSDIRRNRNKFKHVPDIDFAKKNLDVAFEQVFTTLRQKHKAQLDTATATRVKRREDHKALKARRLNRKKTKLNNRSEARKNLEAFSQSVFDGALHQDCMSSEESDGENTEADGKTVQVFRTRGPLWRSKRLLRFYSILDDQDRFEKSVKPKRGLGRRIRREGQPKDGFILPPKGVARWMVSRRWMQEVEAVHPDTSGLLKERIVDPTEPEGEMAHFLLGSEMSEDEVEQAAPGAHAYAHVSDTSYSLHNALQPVG